MKKIYLIVIKIYFIKKKLFLKSQCDIHSNLKALYLTYVASLTIH